MPEPAIAEPRVETMPLRPAPWRAAWSLCRRELVRFVRQRNRVFGAIGQPIIFWILFGAGLGPSFRLAEGAGQALSYREYFFPGTLVLILLFTAIFTTISIIEDRREGFLQSVLVAPIPRWALVLGKVLGGSLIALAQAMVFLALGLLLGLHFAPLAVLAACGWMFITAIALTGLGFSIAWRMDSVQGFHAIMSVFLLPMWLLSGAFFPAGRDWLGWVIGLNPLTYAVAGLRRILYWQADFGAGEAVLAGLPSMAACVVVTLLFTLVTLAIAWRIAGSRTTGDLL